MARFTTAGGEGSGAPGPQGPAGPAGADAVLPQDLGTTDSPTFSKITLTSNGATDNITIGDDVILGDGNIANHVVIIGQQDATQGGIVLGSNETESISTDATNLSLTANNDIVLNPGSTYAYIGTPQLDGSNRIAKMSDITGGTDNHGNFEFITDTLEVRDSSMRLKAYGADEVTLRGEIELNPGNDTGIFRVYDAQTSVFFDGSNWATATWTSTGETSSQLTLTGAPGVYDYFNLSLRQYNQTISINGNTPGRLDGWGSNGTDITIYILDMPVGVDPTVNSVDIYSAYASTVSLDYDDGAMRFDAQGLNINMTTTGSRDINITSADDMTLTAGGDDMTIRAKDDIVFRSGYNSGNTIYEWRMESNGNFEFPGSGLIRNFVGTSGDGYSNDTFDIIPDVDLLSLDQYLIIDPTAPNHIHIRAGGVQDYSNAELILGGERAGVHVSDATGGVRIQSKKEDLSWTYQNISDVDGTTYIVNSEVAEPDYNDFTIVDGVKYIINGVYRDEVAGTTSYTATDFSGNNALQFIAYNSYTFKRAMGEWSWYFNEDGYINGPNQGGLLVNDIERNNGGDLYVVASEGGAVVLNGSSGEYLNDPTIGTNQIATIGDVTTAVGVGGNGEVTRWSPNFTATGLVFTGTDATYPTYNSHYVKNGRMVSFWIEIDLSTVTNFGTGQYITALPYAPLTGTMNHFQAWANVDPTVNPDIAGHVVLQADHLANTTALDLHYLKQAGGANSPLMEAMFTQGAPATLTTASKIYINGTYITAE